MSERQHTAAHALGTTGKKPVVLATKYVLKALVARSDGSSRLKYCTSNVVLQHYLVDSRRYSVYELGKHGLVRSLRLFATGAISFNLSRTGFSGFHDQASHS